jgi:hypothetical protein
MYQPNLFLIKELSANYLKRFELIFSVLPSVDKSIGQGRPPHPYSAMLNALIFKNLRGLTTLTELTREINYYPGLAQLCGFESSPSKERFSSFLKDTPNQFFQSVREFLIRQLIKTRIISGQFVSTDSCPVFANVKQNNLKTNVPSRFDKSAIPKGDPDCRLGAYVVFYPKKKVQFFWGYRNHILNDAESELPIAEITKPADVHESQLLIPQLEYARNKFRLKYKAVIGDSAFDSSKIIEFVAKKLKAKPVIARNPRKPKDQSIELSPKGIPVCIAGFEMISRGKFYDKAEKRWRHKFVCPIKGSKKFARKVGFCPWNHPKFFNNRFGCTTNLRIIDVDQSIRDSIDYSSQTFKKLYTLRTSSERIFSRLLSLCMQRPSVKGLNAIANVCTIAHITVLALALTAARFGHKDKIRFVKDLIPHL